MQADPRFLLELKGKEQEYMASCPPAQLPAMSRSEQSCYRYRNAGIRCNFTPGRIAVIDEIALL